MKKTIILCLVLLISLSLEGCGCEHQWLDATCEKAKTCSLCGKTEGKPLGHEWTGPSCIDSEFCAVCGTEKPDGAEALGHDYQDGYCTVCGEQDPDFVDLDNFGFTNYYDMDEWVEITSYNHKSVKLSSAGSGCHIIKLFSNYFYKCNAIDFCKNGNKDWRTYQYKILSNDVFIGGTYSDCGNTIIERVKINDNALVIKTKQKSNDYEEWYVPADMLDWSSIKDASTTKYAEPNGIGFHGGMVTTEIYEISFKQ